MNLLENYLAAVRRNLPAAQADDIVAELRDDLLARAEAQEDRAGTVDWSALLRDSGHPVAVAARYRKQQWLIGPQLYPFYVDFLKKIVGIVLIVVTVIAVIKTALWPAEIGRMITGYLYSLWTAGAVTIGSVTILFMVIERFSRQPLAEMHQWDPLQLPDVDDAQPGTGECLFEVVFGLLFLLWWVGVIPTPPLTNGAFRLEAAPIWTTLYWPVTALLAGRLIYSILRWLRPRWKTVRLVLGGVTAAGAIAIALIVYRAGQWVTVVPVSIGADQASALQFSLDLAFRIGLVAVMVIWTLSVAAELWKGRGGSRPAFPARG